jgi:hypothetical protein
MTDLELVRKCAKVAGIQLIAVEGDPDFAPYYHDRRYGVISYWPLTNKEQASDLQDILKICVVWNMAFLQWDAWASNKPGTKGVGTDKLRAIVECAAATMGD